MSRLKEYGDKSPVGKLVAICIKTVTALVVTACLAEGVDWRITLSFVVVGAIANEITNFYKWDKPVKEDTSEDKK